MGVRVKNNINLMLVLSVLNGCISHQENREQVLAGNDVADIDSTSQVGEGKRLVKLNTESFIVNLAKWINMEDSAEYRVVERNVGDTLLRLYLDSVPRIIEFPTFEDSGEQVGVAKYYLSEQYGLIQVYIGDIVRSIKVYTKDGKYLHFSMQNNSNEWIENIIPEQAKRELINELLNPYKHYRRKFKEFQFSDTVFIH